MYRATLHYCTVLYCTYLRSVEHRGFVHVIPGEEVQSTAYVLVQCELLSPPETDLGSKGGITGVSKAS
jgi:hypothetical protein